MVVELVTVAVEVVAVVVEEELEATVELTL